MQSNFIQVIYNYSWTKIILKKIPADFSKSVKKLNSLTVEMKNGFFDSMHIFIYKRDYVIQRNMFTGNGKLYLFINF